MRKVKLLALLLAALMVVTAFAGCANTKEIESDVANLDERVSALEGKIDDVKDAIEDSNADEELKAIQDSLKAQEDANKALQEIINKLSEKLDALDKEVDDSKNQDTTDAAALTAAKQEKAKLIAAMKATYEANKADYTADDYAAIVTILSTADIDINAAATVAAVNEIYATMDKEVAAYAQVDDYLYNQYLAYNGNISAATKEGVEAAYKYLKDVAEKHFATNMTKLTVYVYGEDEDGDDLTINLVEWITFLNNLQTSTSTLGFKVPTLPATTMSGKTVMTLDWVTKKATTLVTDIAALGTVVFNKTTALDAVIGTYYGDAGWYYYADYLGDANLALVTNAATLEAAKARLQTLTDAQIAYTKLGDYDTATKSYKSVFAAWTALADKTLYTNKSVYDAINAKLDAWAKAYNLEEENVIAIITDSSTTNNNPNYADVEAAKTNELSQRANYVANSEYVTFMNDAAKAFAKEIAPRILNMNKIEALSAEVFEEYTAIKEAVEAWATRREDDKTTTKVNEEVLVNSANYLAIANAALNYATKISTITGIVDLYAFELASASDFFTTTYAAAEVAAENIEKALDEIQVATASSIEPFIALYGDMVVTNENGVDTYAYVTDYNTEYDAITNNTIMGFLQTYVKEAVVDATTGKVTVPGYDLSVLLPLDEYKTKKEAVVSNLAARAAEAAAIEDAWKAYVAAVANTFAATEKANDWAAGTITATTTLAHKADLDAIVALYKAWVVAGGATSMQTFDLVEGSTTKYAFNDVIDVTVLTGLNTHKTEMDSLNTWATNMANIFKILADLNTASAFKFNELGSYYSVLKNEKVTYNMIDATSGLEETKTAYKYTFYTTSGTAGTSSYKWSSKTGYETSNSSAFKKTKLYNDKYCTGNKTDAVKISTLIEGAAKNYTAFVKANGYQDWAAVETAKADYKFNDILLVAVKYTANALVNTYNNTLVGGTDYVTATKEAIGAAKNVDGIATALLSYFAASSVYTRDEEIKNSEDKLVATLNETEYVTYNGVNYISVYAPQGQAPVVKVLNTIG